MIPKTRSFRDPRNPIGVLILLAAFAAAAGCSTANTTGGGDVIVNHVNASGNSVPGWVTPTGGLHANSATMNYIANGGSSSCTECHGSDLAGGISKVSCFGNPAGCHHGPVANWATPAVHGAAAKKAPGSSGFASCQICHGNDFIGGGVRGSCFTCHGVFAPHARKPWRGLLGSPYTHTDTNTSNATVCAQCHFPGSPNNPANHPATPAPAGTAPGCFNSTLCHGASGAPHPVPYNDNSHFTVTLATFPGSCSACHDVSAPSTKVGPVCQTCHVAASPLAAANCTSCHASPPNGGAGAVYANIAGAHATHIALTSAGTPISCDTCHNGSGTNTLNHYNRAKFRVSPGDVFFNSSYLAESGTRNFDNVSTSPTYLTCNAVSCHGGQATPNWRTGTITPTTQCTSCHASGDGQFNSYNSGRHGDHSGGSFACTECHDMDVATNNKAGVINHFKFLGTSGMEGPAKDTFRNSTGSVVYTPGATAGTGTCTGTCHGETHNESW